MIMKTDINKIMSAVRDALDDARAVRDARDARAARAARAALDALDALDAALFSCARQIR